jgi:hypothetical protein
MDQTRPCGKMLPRDRAANCSLLEKVAESFGNVAQQSCLERCHNHRDRSLRPHGRQYCVQTHSALCTVRVLSVAQIQMHDGDVPGPGESQAHQESSIGLHGDGAPESLTHFACVRPKFRDARRSAHNKVRLCET